MSSPFYKYPISNMRMWVNRFRERNSTPVVAMTGLLAAGGVYFILRKLFTGPQVTPPPRQIHQRRTVMEQIPPEALSESSTIMPPAGERFNAPVKM
ncbi:hypothetical protein H696_02596 [Fonticula alba]|uniref:Uncharacterized protein n=1 Tax=Fonticula alba TaxID=691883 RepID=A0A058Z820_FONAL|nr:hypothetical protein H696_02596 [Fonticula alba]KCV70266.1 hypothetical protein H696_02596 [Fonticula alba]|eukprot:XP_009494782.1 hypothetical protein H696_02596 [Fonticula alba]